MDRFRFISLIFVLVAGSLFAAESESAERLQSFIGGALAEVADQNWDAARKELRDAQVFWNASTHTNSQGVGQVDAALKHAIESLPAEGIVSVNLETIAQAKNALNDLAFATERLVGSEKKSHETTPASEALLSLNAAVKNLLEETNSGSFVRLSQGFKKLEGAWSKAEGLVRTTDSSVYAEFETQLSVSRLALSAEPPNLVALHQSLSTMSARLGALTPTTSYGFWDAAFILFREGLEALLVLAALLAFLNKTGNREKRIWVWSGAGSGLVVSIVAAFALSGIVSAVAAGSAREATEGLVGLVAVALMLSVGLWLHAKSNIKKWNAYIKDKMGKALAAGSLISLAVISFLAVVREGAESIVFFLGIASSMSSLDLLWGISAALAVLTLLGVLIIRFAAKLPLPIFFKAATILISYLSFKILGESLHSLQAAGLVGTHELGGLQGVAFLGIYPTWEGCLPQLLLLLALIFELTRTEWKRRLEKRNAGEAGVTAK